MLSGTVAYIAQTVRNTFHMVRADAAIYLLIIVYTIAGFLLLAYAHRPDLSSHGLYIEQWTTMFLVAMPALALLFDALYVIHRFDNRRTLAFRRAFSPRRMSCLFAGMILLMGLMVFQGTFTSIKNVMPVLQGGFLYDHVQANIDAAIHFGVDPWRILYSFAEMDFIRRVIEWNYNVFWFLFCFGSLFFVVTSPKARAIRTRYLVMFMLVWIVCGNVLAGLFLSAGPAFYGAVTGDTARFGEMIEFLTRSGNEFSSAYRVQTYLWELHSSGSAGFGSGVSAFPSVHVALIAMNAFFLAERRPRLGIPAFLYVGFILAGSVFLGWHYAIDGYASIAMVGFMHYVCRRVIPDFCLAKHVKAEALPPGVGPVSVSRT